MKVPLGVFAADKDGDCQLYIQSSAIPTVVFGSMFFEQFSGQFTNSYTDAAVSTSVAVSVQTTASYASQSYIGDQSLSQGDNPFIINDDDGDNLLWLWIVIGVVVAALLGGMVYYLFCRKPLNK